MSFKFCFSLIIILVFNAKCKAEVLAINCKENKVKILNLDQWKDINNLISCPLHDNDILSICKSAYNNNEFSYILPIKSVHNNKTCFNTSCDTNFYINYKLFKCFKNNNDIVNPLSVRHDCVFKHMMDTCQMESVWKKKANDACESSSEDIDFELFQLNGIFPCIKAFTEKNLNFKAIQYVCCPKMKTYEWYMQYVSLKNATIKSEMIAYSSAKHSLRKKFKLRQNRIKDRYIAEEKAINIWLTYPKLALSVENSVKDRFRQSFMIEMNKEVELLKQLELLHENKIQKLYEESRKNSRSRLEYTLQETNVEISRVAAALKLELDSILVETEDIITFRDSLYTKGLTDEKNNLELIKENFNNLIIQSWKNVLDLIEKNNLMKGEVIKVIKSLDLKRKALINRFINTNNEYNTNYYMEKQADNYINNIISSFEHGKSLKDSKNKLTSLKHLNKTDSLSLYVILISFLVALALIVTALVSFVLYRYSNKIMYYLSNAFKRVHPKTKNVFVQIENYPFKNRYNYGNNISQSQSKIDESFIGQPFVYNYQFNATKKSSDDSKMADLDYSDTSTSNINGLENPICRLLDEK